MLVQHWNFQHTLFPHPSLCFLTFNTFCLILAKSLPFPNPLSFWLTHAFAPFLVCKPEVQPNTIKKWSKFCLAHSPCPGLQAPSLPARFPPLPFLLHLPDANSSLALAFSAHNLNYSRNYPTPSYQHSLTTGCTGKCWCKSEVCVTPTLSRSWGLY